MNADMQFVPTLTFTVAEAAQRIPCSERWLADGLREGRFRGRKIMGQWRLTEGDLHFAIDACLDNRYTPISLAPTARSQAAHRSRGG